MRIAIQSPWFVTASQIKNYEGYNFAFVERYRPILYFPRWTGWRAFLRLCRAMINNGLNPLRYEFCFSLAQLRRTADVLICFNGFPYKEGNSPPKQFSGLKVWHAHDYVFRATQANQLLTGADVNYVMGYSSHDLYCRFFQSMYPRYIGRVMPVPFGYGTRFRSRKEFAERTPKVIGIGSVNPVDDPVVTDRTELADYANFYKGVFWTHQWRRMLAENADSLSDIFSSRYPMYPQTKDAAYDAVALLNEFQMFANDEGLMNFPPARTYEGVAAGAVLVCSDHPCYDGLGFIDGVNCIRNRRHDLVDFRNKVEHYLRHPEVLSSISRSGTEMVRREFSHFAIAGRIHAMIEAALTNTVVNRQVAR